MSKTDDGYFSKKTRDKLFAWAGAECSAPWCKTRTIAGSTSTSSGASDVGEAAHILGRTLTSPRYDKTQSNAARVHFDNGIWLCRLHAAAIDRNDSIYTKELLLQWKEARHEDALRDQSGAREERAELFNFEIEVDLGTPPPVDSIIDFMQAAGVSIAWGDDVQGEASRVVYEILHNAQRHGSAKSAILRSAGTEIQVTHETHGAHFGIDQLLAAANPRGGHNSVTDWNKSMNAQFRLGSHSKGSSSTWTFSDIRDGNGASGPCSTVVEYKHMDDRHHGPYSPDCAEVILYIKNRVSYSDIHDLIPTIKQALSDRPVLIVSKDATNLKLVESVNEHRDLGWRIARRGSALHIQQ